MYTGNYMSQVKRVCECVYVYVCTYKWIKASQSLLQRGACVIIIIITIIIVNA